MRKILHTGPTPYDAAGNVHPLGWCAVCAMLLKNEANERYKDEANAAQREDGPPAVFDVLANAVPGDFTLDLAVTMTPYAPLGNMILPVCWSHVTALTMNSSGIMPVTGQLPNGQQVPEIGRGRR